MSVKKGWQQRHGNISGGQISDFLLCVESMIKMTGPNGDRRQSRSIPSAEIFTGRVLSKYGGGIGGVMMAIV